MNAVLILLPLGTWLASEPPADGRREGKRGNFRERCSYPTCHPLQRMPLKEPPAKLSRTPVSIPHSFSFQDTSLLSWEGQRRPKQVKAFDVRDLKSED